MAGVGGTLRRLTTLSEAMSTPSSIVGEQNSSGSWPVRNSCLALLTHLGGNLGGVLAGLDPLAAVDDRPVQLDEERVGAPAVARRLRHADRVVERLVAVTGQPAQLRGLQPVAGHRSLGRARRRDLDKPVQAKRFEQAGDDPLGVLQRQPIVLGGERAAAAEVETEAAPRRDVDRAAVVVGGAGAREQRRAVEQRLVARRTPTGRSAAELERCLSPSWRLGSSTSTLIASSRRM